MAGEPVGSAPPMKISSPNHTVRALVLLYLLLAGQGLATTGPSLDSVRGDFAQADAALNETYQQARQLLPEP